MTTIVRIGERLPDVPLTGWQDGAPVAVGSTAFFADRRVALFAVPGAYTPTCSARHLPGFVEREDALRAAGIEAVACTAVNDIFVLASWLEANGADGRIAPLADGNGDFARALGLAQDLSGFGMGVRSHRYALVATDGVIEQLLVDQPGEFRVSSADTLLAALARSPEHDDVR